MCVVGSINADQNANAILRIVQRHYIAHPIRNVIRFVVRRDDNVHLGWLNAVRRTRPFIGPATCSHLNDDRKKQPAIYK